jgi:hypothetical protein
MPNRDNSPAFGGARALEEGQVDEKRDRAHALVDPMVALSTSSPHGNVRSRAILMRRSKPSEHSNPDSDHDGLAYRQGRSGVRLARDTAGAHWCR